MLPTKLVTLFLAVVVSKHHGHHHHRSYLHSHLSGTTRSSNNFFTQVSRTVLKVMNEVFDSLDISEKFIKESKIKVFIKMHYNLNKISAKNFEVFNVLRNVSKLKVDNKSLHQIHMNNFIIRILNKKEFDGYNITENDTISNKTFGSEVNENKRFKHLVGGYIGKLKRLTIEDLIKKKENTNFGSESRRRNLDVWEPTPVKESFTYNNTYRRIFGGKSTNIFTYPFMASVHILDDFMCAGSIITKDLVLTAASCLQIHHNNRFFRENPKTTYVRVGSDWTSRRGEVISVLEVYFYPQYDPKTLNHNLAIMRLGRQLNLNRRRARKVRRILLDRGNGNLAANTHGITILGWGARKANQIVNPFEKLTYQVLSIYQIKDCKEIYSKATDTQVSVNCRDFVTENHFCAGFLSKGGGACNRDVGGPGIVDNLLMGVVSFGAPVCGVPDAPTVFTRVGHYIDWIEHIMSLKPIVFGKRTTVTVEDKFLIYYNTTPSSTKSFSLVPQYRATIGELSSPPSLRAHDIGEESYEEGILRAIIKDLTINNDSTIKDVIYHDLYEDFQEILKEKPEDNTGNEILASETPIVTFNLPLASATTQVDPKFLPSSTPAPPVFLRPADVNDNYDVYGMNNFN